MKCEMCKFFHRVDPNIGTCREGSPQLTFFLAPLPPQNVLQQGRQGVQVANQAGWPPVGNEDWCGRFEEKRLGLIQ